jgi:hypothetical protein
MLRYLLLPATAAAILWAGAGPALADPVPSAAAAVLTSGSSTTAAAILWAGAGPALADPVPSAAAAVLTSGSSAAILHLRFVVNGKKTDPDSEVPATGSAPPTYNKTAIRSAYSKSTRILGGLTFDSSATGIQGVATGRAAAAGIDASGSATVGSFRGTLKSQQGTLMTLTTGRITSQGSFTETKAGVRTVAGGTTLLKVKIDAPALGINKTYSGSPKPNQVLYHNGDNSIIVYLNRQITTTRNNKVKAIAVDALDVQIKDYKVAGNTISGTITVAPTFAW